MYIQSLNMLFIHVHAELKKKPQTCRCHVGILKIVSSESFPYGFQSNFQGNHWKHYTVVLVPLGGAAFIVFLTNSLWLSIYLKKNKFKAMYLLYLLKDRGVLLYLFDKDSYPLYV